jgi:hypothetical protein
MRNNKMDFKVGDYIIQNIEETESMNYDSAAYKNLSKLLKTYQVIYPVNGAGYVKVQNGNNYSNLKAEKFRLANEKEIKSYKLKSMFRYWGD